MYLTGCCDGAFKLGPRRLHRFPSADDKMRFQLMFAPAAVKQDKLQERTQQLHVINDATCEVTASASHSGWRCLKTGDAVHLERGVFRHCGT